MPVLKEFDLWFMDYTTDAGKVHDAFPFRTQRQTVGVRGNPASTAASGAFAWTERSPDLPCVGSNECVKPRKLICVLQSGETYAVPVPTRDSISAGVIALKGAGCICVHLEGEEITDPRTNLIPSP